MLRLIYHLLYFSSGIQYKFKQRVTPSGFAVFLCLVTTAVLGFDTTQGVNYQIFTFLLSISMNAIAWSLFFRLRWTATRTISRFATVGTILKYRLVIHNKTHKIQTGLKLRENFADPRPSFAEFRQITPPNQNPHHSFLVNIISRWVWLVGRKQGTTTETIDLPTLPAHTQTEIILKITPTHRGEIRFTQLTLARPDPFGLFNACVTIPLPQSLLVLPKLYNIPPIQLPGFRRYQSGGITLASSVGDSTEFRSLRDYRPGDPLRKIHWKSWAKMGKPIVKEEQDEFFVRHALILDTFQDQKYSEVLESAISVAASFAYEVQTQESLLDLMFVGNEAYCFTFGRGLSHTDRMLEILASVSACQDKSFDALIPIVIDRVSLMSGCICILLTWDEERKKLINYLQKMGIYALILMMDSGDKNLDIEIINSKFISFHILNLGKIQEQLINL
jgi:uncharacterized protein (DUF58 family)